MPIQQRPNSHERKQAAAHPAVVQTENRKNQVVHALIAFTSTMETRAIRRFPGLDVAEVVAQTQDKALAAMESSQFPWDDPEPVFQRMWNWARDECLTAARGHGVGMSASLVRRITACVEAVRHAGSPVVADTVYDAGCELYPAKSRPSRDAIVMHLQELLYLDSAAPGDRERAVQVDIYGRCRTQRSDLDGLNAVVPFLPTEQTHRDIARLEAARDADRRDDGGVDATRLDIIAVLRFETKSYDNGKEVPAYPVTRRLKLTGVTKERMAELYAELDVAIEAARPILAEARLVG